MSVLNCIHELLPAEDLLYIADTQYAPYGEKEEGFIKERAYTLTSELISRDVKAIVVACNTVTVSAIAHLREHFSLPIIGIEPGVKPAADSSRSGIVGVMATMRTLDSASFQSLIHRFADGQHIISQPCNGLMEQIEQAELDSAATRELVFSFVKPLLEQGADTIVLGCTHYPFVLPIIREAAGCDVQIIDTGYPVAREVKRQLEKNAIQAPQHRNGRITLFTSGDRDTFQLAAAKLLNRTFTVKTLERDG